MKVLINKKINITDICIFIILLCALGFPGNYCLLLGDAFGVFMDYFAFALQLCLMAASFTGKIKITKNNYVPYLFLIYLFSASMAVTNYVALELISCIRLTVTGCFGIWLAHKFSAEKIIKLLCQTQILFVILTLIFTVIMPGAAFQNLMTVSNAYCGLLPSKNNCASVLAFALMFFAALIKNNRAKGVKTGKIYWVFIVIQIVMLLACKATGAIFCALIPIIYILFFSEKRFNLGLLYTLGNGFFIVFVLKILPKLSSIMSAIGKDVTLTGRTTFWDRIIYVVFNTKKWMGYGHTMFWRDPSGYRLVQKGFSKYTFAGSETAGSHNTIVEMFADTGIIGIAAFALMLIASMTKPERLSKCAYNLASISILFFLIHGFTERSLGTFNYASLFLFTAIGLYSSAKALKSEEISV